MVINVLGLEGLNPESIADVVLVAYVLSKGGMIFEDNAGIDFNDVQEGLRDNFSLDLVGIKDMYKVMKEQNEKEKEKSLRDMISILIARSKEDSRYAKLKDATMAFEDAIADITKTYAGESDTIMELAKTKYNTISNFIDKKKQIKGE